MSKRLSVTELVRSFSDHINRVAYLGEHLVLTRGKRAVAELRPLPVGRKLGELPAVLDSLPRLSRAEADEFGEAIREARDEPAKERPRDPWES